MSGPKISQFSALMELQDAPIQPDWIVEGAPVARNRLIAPSTDRFGWTMLWDCTAGKFHWHYTIDETVHVIEGGVTVTDEDGKTFTLRAGDIAYFPAGSTALWHVENYIRKVAYCQKPVPAPLAYPLRVLRRVMAIVGGQVREVIRLIGGSLAEPVSAPELPAPEQAPAKRALPAR